MRTRITLMVLSAGLLGCEPEGTPASDDGLAGETVDNSAVREAIEAQNGKLMAAFKAGDPAAAAAVYTSDAMFMAPNAPAMAGDSGIVQGLRGLFSQITVTDFTLTIRDVMVAGDLAVETGMYTMTYGQKGGNTVITDKGKYLTVFKRQADGSWKLARDIFNSDLPVAQ